MAQGDTVFSGVIRGKTIELDAGVGLPDGQEVIVIVRPKPSAASDPPPGAGSWADMGDAEYDAWMTEWRRGRDADRPGPS